ncbi:MAG: outer membrane beta-barrel protein [Saprospiraceae bacterium]|nr:outer membrane beta-barrel protein [Saprospiraceae bacterium]
MKALTLSIICCFVCISAAQAQKIIPLSLTPKLGVNFNDFIIEENSSSAISLARMGWNLGMDVSYGKRLQAKGGAHFFQLGTGIETMTPDGPVREKVSSSQFKFPVGASYKVWNVEYFNLWIQGQVVMNLTTKMVHGEAETESNIYPRSGLGGRLGIGMDIGRLVLEVNYERSFTEMIRQQFDARSKLINFSLGLKI